MNVFISYSRLDEVQVRILRDALLRQGVPVWWDNDLHGAEVWRDRLETELARAACVIVVWSRNSVRSGGEFVRDEAARALKRGVLIPVRIDDSAPPLGFGEHQVIDLSKWRGNDDDPDFQRLIIAVRVRTAASSVLSTPSARPSRRISPRLVGAALLAALVVIWFSVRGSGLLARSAASSDEASAIQPNSADSNGSRGQPTGSSSTRSVAPTRAAPASPPSATKVIEIGSPDITCSGRANCNPVHEGDIGVVIQ